MKKTNLTKLAVIFALTASTALLAQPKGWVPGDKPHSHKGPERHGQGYDTFREGDYVEPRHHAPGPAPRPLPRPAPRPLPPPAPRPLPPPAPRPAPHHAPRPVPPPPHRGPAPGYRPGHHGLFHSHPHDRAFYSTWRFLRHHDFFRFDVLPSTLQIAMRNFTATDFDLEENTTTGYTWFARFDSTYCDVSIVHHGSVGLPGAPGKANIRISAKNPGDTLVEFIYARRWEWEQGIAPNKVIQLYVHIEP